MLDFAFKFQDGLMEAEIQSASSTIVANSCMPDLIGHLRYIKLYVNMVVRHGHAGKVRRCRWWSCILRP